MNAGPGLSREDDFKCICHCGANIKSVIILNSELHACMKEMFHLIICYIACIKNMFFMTYIK